MRVKAKHILAAGALLAAAAFGDASVALSSFPASGFPDTEWSTNFCFAAWRRGDAAGRNLSIDICFAGTASNNAEVAFGTRRELETALALRDTRFVAGWDCGHWFVRANGLRDTYRAEGVGPLRLRWSFSRDGSLCKSSFSANGVPVVFRDAGGAALTNWPAPFGVDILRVTARGPGARAGAAAFDISPTGGAVYLR